ncbi:MAG TPA: ABC-2 family transporter protein [Acidimicrobiales bacterium]|nr:ABC-2 family transporter protein [Acidimicrobiales bacterium]
MSAATSRWFAVGVGTAARRALAERGGLAFTLTFYAVIVVVITALWRAAAESGGGTVAGYDATALTWYILASEAATVALNIRMIEVVGDDIASGAVATEMLRPASVLGVRMAAEIGRALPRLAGCAAVGVVVGATTVGAVPSAAGLALSVPALVLAIAANLLAQHAFAAAAFWVRDARSTWFLYQKLVFILGGMLLPLETLPGWLHGVASALPFMAMAYVPGRLASGHVEAQLLVVQAAWIAVLAGVAATAFAAGERRVQAVGG